MTIGLAILLGAIQAITEFLPVSSSGHLAVFQILFASSFDVTHVPLSFDVFVHAATALATVTYLRREIVLILCNLFSKTVAGERARRLAFLLIVATIPAGIIGVFFKDLLEAQFSSLRSVALGFFITTLALESAHRRQRTGDKPRGTLDDLDWPFPTLKQALIIGFAQAIAIWPGISRSGSTIATALLCGLSATTAVRFSFFLSLPAILGACILELGELSTLQSSEYTAYALGFLTTFIVGFAAIHLLVKAVSELKLRGFGLYTAALGLFLLLFS